ncbi:MAG TPA: hypothetical protein VML35_09590 [Gaiellaceae bacterium]|nr:hypothetical protein [Gaiellaceae bacterium]
MKRSPFAVAAALAAALAVAAPAAAADRAAADVTVVPGETVKVTTPSGKVIVRDLKSKI